MEATEDSAVNDFLEILEVRYSCRALARHYIEISVVLTVCMLVLLSAAGHWYRLVPVGLKLHRAMAAMGVQMPYYFKDIGSMLSSTSADHRSPQASRVADATFA